FRVPTRMTDPAAQIIRPAIDSVSYVFRLALLPGSDGFAQFAAQPFVGVERKHPIVRGLRRGKVLLFAEVGKWARNHASPQFARDFARAVRAPGIDHHDFVSHASQRLQRVGQVRLLVVGDENRADRRHARADERILLSPWPPNSSINATLSSRGRVFRPRDLLLLSCPPPSQWGSSL